MHETRMCSSFQKYLTSKNMGLTFQYGFRVPELHFSHTDKVHQTISPAFHPTSVHFPFHGFVCGKHSDLNEARVQKTQHTANKPLNHSALVSYSKMGVTTLSS